ncbi:hypothetical protein EI94DRAFT_1798656 [Lactarius quietus]|nr:hypothetical protein EI94DRAFT_1798656 [Lactarius quietus]
MLLKIVTVEEVRLNRPGLGRNRALNPSALHAPSTALDGNGTCARCSFRFRLFVLLDDLLFAMIAGGGGNAGGEGSSSVGGIGVGSIHSSSSRSAESDDIVREKFTSTAVAFCVLLGVVLLLRLRASLRLRRLDSIGTNLIVRHVVFVLLGI